jgi:hypothetical protein
MTPAMNAAATTSRNDRWVSVTALMFLAKRCNEMNP